MRMTNRYQQHMKRLLSPEYQINVNSGVKSPLVRPNYAMDM